MNCPIRARRVARIADVAATVLLALPAAVLAWQYAGVREFYWLRGGGNADAYEVPRLAVAGLALAAAIQLRRRFGRAVGVGLGSVALLGALASQLTGDGCEYWARYDVLGDGRPWANWPWIAGTALALALVPRRGEPVAVRVAAMQARGVARWIPAALAVSAGVALAALTWGRIEAIYESRCSSKNDWLDTNILQATAELTAACLILVPGTRRPGLRFGALLFQGTAVWSACQWRDGAPGRDYVGLAGFEGIWAAQTALGAVFALVLALAYFRELHVHALRALARHDGPRLRSRMPALLVRFRVFRRTHREAGARRLWAAPVAAALLGASAASSLAGLAREVLVPFVYDGASRTPAADTLVVLAAAELAAAAWLLRAATRARGASVGLAAIAMEVVVHFSVEPLEQVSKPMTLLLLAGSTGIACVLSMWGVRETDTDRLRSHFTRAGDSLRAVGRRLGSCGQEPPFAHRVPEAAHVLEDERDLPGDERLRRRKR